MNALVAIAGAILVTLLAWTVVAISAPSIPTLITLEAILWVLVGWGGRELARSNHASVEEGRTHAGTLHL